MPTEVKNRVRCLKNIQVDLLKLESQFYQEVQKLEAKFQTLYQPLLNKVWLAVYHCGGLKCLRLCAIVFVFIMCNAQLICLSKMCVSEIIYQVWGNC